MSYVIVSNNSLLHYYDPRKPAYLQCYASMICVGAALLQPDAGPSRMQVRFLHPLNSATLVSSANSCRSYSECNDSMDGSSMTTDLSS